MYNTHIIKKWQANIKEFRLFKSLKTTSINWLAINLYITEQSKIYLYMKIVVLIFESVCFLAVLKVENPLCRAGGGLYM